MAVRNVASIAYKARTDDGERIYAIGDVHGRFDLLQALLDKVEAHDARLPRPRTSHIVLLGDLVDRGPQSSQVLRMIYERQRRDPSLIVLLGNHEELMLGALDNEMGMLRAWLRSGGAQTVESFGLEVPPRDADPRVFTELLKRAIPAEWIKWLRGLPLTVRSRDYVFCHAGIRPGVPLKKQVRNDLLWIRDDFLFDENRHEAIVIHGHSVSPDVEVRHNRIGIDTGAYRTGLLSALYVENDAREVISTGPEA